MDFMHPLDNYAHPVDEIKYLGTPYEGTAFDDFPDYHGFNRILVLDGFFKGMQASRVEAFIQAWLYLGLLIEVLNEGLGLKVQGQAAQLKTGDFIHTRHGQQFVTTARLGSYLDSWREHAKKIGPNESERSRDNVAHFIRTARTFSSKVLTIGASKADNFPFQPETQSSLVVLGSLLDGHASLIYGGKAGNWPQSLVALQRLSGICPSELSWLQSQFTSEVVYYRSALLWPKDGKDHAICDGDSCVANQIDADDYVTLHVTGQCQCPWVGPNEDELVAVLEEGRIPLISLQPQGEEILGLKVTTAAVNPGIPYAAISHVWSDGLGNPRANKLPLCQLSKLRRLINELFKHKPALFWIDTLCVPHWKSGKRLAIQKMKATYQQAERVLVLDAQLERTLINFLHWEDKLEASSHTELAKAILIRITLCGWMRRLWTFQEGAIAKELEFQFADGAINLRQLLVATRGDRSTVANQILTQLMILRSLAYPLEHGLKLVHILHALEWRSTSNAEDEAICIASLLDLSPETFFDLPIEQHMPQLLTAIRSIPSSLLFSKGPRLNSPNFGWAPRSFLNSHNILDLANEGNTLLAFCDGSGLKVSLPGWGTVQTNMKPSGTFWWIQEIPPGSRLMQVVRADQNDQLCDWNTSDFAVHPAARIGFVVKPAIQTLLPTGTTNFFKGICVAIVSESGHTLFAKFICRVVVMTCDYRELLTDITIEPDEVEQLNEDQNWCFL
jgi:hypothetical protein